MAEIKISELSIGDWVEMGGKIFQIYLLALAGDVYGYRRTDNSFAGEEYYDGEIGDVHPIPLTPEILEKNGFTRWVLGSNKGDYYLDSPRTKRVWLYYDFGTYKMAYIRNTGGCETFFKCRDIASVHQLQHALRLAGVEKEIEV